MMKFMTSSLRYQISLSTFSPLASLPLPLLSLFFSPLFSVFLHMPSSIIYVMCILSTSSFRSTSVIQPLFTSFIPFAVQVFADRLCSFECCDSIGGSSLLGKIYYARCSP
ncbi:MAG: hypothetical protein BYD32DRAFT_93863 [Podila humilis]|nr:MAG: hypothetical protein BYD32DRAFT_93863 [Podila humilis]